MVMAGLDVLLLSCFVPVLQPANDEIRRAIMSQWPKHGAVFVEYDDDGRNRQWAGFHFATGAWFYEERGRVLGVDPSGTRYVGKPVKGGVSAATKTFTGFSSCIDHIFPQIAVAELLASKSLSTSIGERLADGSREIRWQLPRGSRAIMLDEMPKPELDRWGGASGILREVKYKLSSSWSVESVQCKGKPEMLIDRDDRSPEGFQVVRACPDPWTGLRLVSCEYDAQAPSQLFSMRAIEDRIVDRRLSLRERTPVLLPGDPALSDVNSIRSKPETLAAPGASAFVFGGVLVAAVGVVAWIRKRRAV